jgi:hypothetical protein
MASWVHGMDRQECVYIMKSGVKEKGYGPVWVLGLIEGLEACEIVAGLLEMSIL